MYLAQFWHYAKEPSGAITMPKQQRKWWEEQYNRHKNWLRFKNNKPHPYWSGLNFRELATEIGFRDTYDQDYRLLSNIAHCSACGLLLEKAEEQIQIQTDRLIGPILVYGTKYMLWVTAHWNEHFKLVEGSKLDEILNETMNFKNNA